MGLISVSMLAYPFLVSDIDGTLVTDQKQIPSLVRQAIAQFRQSGGVFTLATGRNYAETERFIRELEVDLPVILCNGALLYDPNTRELTPTGCPERGPGPEIPEDIRPFKSAESTFFVYTVHHIYATHIGPLSEAGLQNEEPKSEIDHLLRDAPGRQDWVKIAAVADEEGIDELRQLVGRTKISLHLRPILRCSTMKSFPPASPKVPPFNASASSWICLQNKPRRSVTT